MLVEGKFGTTREQFQVYNRNDCFMPLEPELNLFRICSPQEDPLHIRITLTADVFDIDWYRHFIVPASDAFEAAALLDKIFHLLLHDHSVR